jgi:hypothetical protein
MMLRIDQTGSLENRDKVIEVTVNVANGDYGFRLLCRCFGWLRPSDSDRQQEQEARNISTM